MIEQIAFWVNVVVLVAICTGLILNFFGMRQDSKSVTWLLACGLVPLTGLMTYPNPAATWALILLWLGASGVFIACLFNAYRKWNAGNDPTFGLVGAFIAISSVFVCGVSLVL